MNVNKNEIMTGLQQLSGGPFVIPPDSWKKNRTRIVARVKRKLHITESNPGPEFNKLRYDYVLTAAEVATLVEEVMRETERIAVWHMRHPK